MLARRYSLPPVTEALYDPRDVPSCDASMTDTVIVKPKRELWMKMLGELVQAAALPFRSLHHCSRRLPSQRRTHIFPYPLHPSRRPCRR